MHNFTSTIFLLKMCKVSNFFYFYFARLYTYSHGDANALIHLNFNSLYIFFKLLNYLKFVDPMNEVKSYLLNFWSQPLKEYCSVIVLAITFKTQSSNCYHQPRPIIDYSFMHVSIRMGTTNWFQPHACLHQNPQDNEESCQSSHIIKFSFFILGTILPSPRWRSRL